MAASFGHIAFHVAILELAVVSAKNEVAGKTTVFDEFMVLMTSRRVPNRFFGIRDWAYYRARIREFKVIMERNVGLLL